jgi:tripartite-type tricarboxylate transporter receptor subunit TctC
MKEFFQRLGITPHMVRYKSGAELAVAAFRGDVDVYGADAITGKPHVEGQKTRAIGTGWTETLSVYPDAVPLASAAPGFTAYNIQTVSAPKGTPDHIMQFYNRLFRDAVHHPDIQHRWAELKIVLQDLDLTQSARLVRMEQRKFQTLHRPR